LGAAPPPPAAPGKSAQPFARARAAIGGLLGVRSGRRPRLLSGAIVWQSDKLAIVEIVLSEAIDWSPPRRVAITWGDGTTTEAPVLADHSTRPLRAAAGASVKVALDVADARAIASLAFDHGEEHWTVTL
jgi:hypothetical protein